MLRYIRDHACEGIDVPDALDAVPQSRRRLEYRFKKLLGRTPHEEIVRVRLERVKSLLRGIGPIAGEDLAPGRVRVCGVPQRTLPPEVRHAAQRLPLRAKAVGWAVDQVPSPSGLG